MGLFINYLVETLFIFYRKQTISVAASNLVAKTALIDIWSAIIYILCQNPPDLRFSTLFRVCFMESSM